MKKKELENHLKLLGWWKEREGGKHEVWTNGDLKAAVPRHKEINKYTANAIIKTAINNPGKGEGL